MTEQPGTPRGLSADTPGKSRDTALLVALSIIGILVVVALIAVFSRGTPGMLDADTPEGVVQRYSAAVIDGDELTAAEYLTPGAVEDCEDYGSDGSESMRVTLVSTTERDASADVRVSITTTYGSRPFGVSESEFVDEFDLVTIDGVWLIDTAPWPLTICPKAG